MLLDLAPLCPAHVLTRIDLLLHTLDLGMEALQELAVCQHLVPPAVQLCDAAATRDEA